MPEPTPQTITLPSRPTRAMIEAMNAATAAMIAFGTLDVSLIYGAAVQGMQQPPDANPIAVALAAMEIELQHRTAQQPSRPAKAARMPAPRPKPATLPAKPTPVGKGTSKPGRKPRTAKPGTRK